MESFADNCIAVYDDIIKEADPRTSGWLFVPTPSLSVVLVAVYIAFVTYAGPRWMKNKSEMDLGWILPCFNFVLVVLNYHIAKELLTCAVAEKYTLCQPMNRDPTNENEMRIAKAIWWYYISKIIEMLDTVWFVLRKRDRQVTFLHVYHHSAVVLIGWCMTRLAPGGQTLYVVLYNSSTHVVMYTYYGLAACGPKIKKYLWWKRYLTILQISQLMVIFTHAMLSLHQQCDFPEWMHWCLFAFIAPLIILFGNFYLQAYKNKVDEKKLN